MLEKEWYTLRQASLKVGKSAQYFSNLKKRQPKYFEDIPLHRIGNNAFIHEKDIEKVMSRVKKQGDRSKSNVLKRSTKQKVQFCFYPQ